MNERFKNLNPADFSRLLLAWFARHGRHDLPWQQQRTPYRVWVSEIMLQQTQVATATPYYQRFMARFADVALLACASLDEVLHHWSGLGYYARARNLHRAARQVMERHAGEIPADLDTLLSLPGIGRSTAGAILALSHDQRHPILDGNVKRVLARCFGIDGDPGSAPVLARLWSLSDAVTPDSQVADYTQAVMDLGATVCTRSKPACGRCPVVSGCVANATGRTAELPGARPGRKRPARRVVWLVIRQETQVLLQQRPPTGIWGGLWGFPEFPTPVAALRAARERAPGTPTRPVPLPPVTHAFTHFQLEIQPLLWDLGPDVAVLMQRATDSWYNSRAPAKGGLAAPVTALLAGLAAPGRR